MILVIDPLVASPGVRSSTDVAELIDMLMPIVDSPTIDASCPKYCRDRILSEYAEAEDSYLNHDVLRMVGDFLMRLSTEIVADEEDPLLDEIKVEPEYSPPTTHSDLVPEVLEFVATSGFFEATGCTNLGIFSEHFDVGDRSNRAAISAVRYPANPSEPSEAFGSDIAILPSLSDLFSRIAEHPRELMGDLPLGIAAVGESKGWVLEPTAFEFGPDFIQSVKDANYKNNKRYSAACLRIAAAVAAREDKTFAGHPERDGAGPGNPTIIHAKSGAPVMRARLASNSSNAHRLFWVDAEKRILLNVSGHEGQPSL